MPSLTEKTPLREAQRIAAPAPERIGLMERAVLLEEADAIAHARDPRPAEPVLRIERLSMGYDADTTALRGISMDIPRNRVTALIGPSGCGKSTFLRCLNRMNDFIPTRWIDGSIRLQGVDIYRSADAETVRGRIGMVFQQPNPFPLSIAENVAYAPRLRGMRRRAQLDEVVERCLSQAGLWEEVKDRLREPATSLSGGQAQRLCIARALAGDPEVLLLDEATSALDPIATGVIEGLIRELSSSYTIVMVTHNMLQARRVADETAFFLMGELVEHGPTERIFHEPRDSRTASYVSGHFG